MSVDVKKVLPMPTSPNCSSEKIVKNGHIHNEKGVGKLGYDEEKAIARKKIYFLHKEQGHPKT